MNPLEKHPKIRQALYDVQWGTTGVMALIAAGFAAAQHGLPQWYGVTAGVLSVLWAYTGITARSNVPENGEDNGPED